MRRGKLIVLAGTDGSGKELQTKKLAEKLNRDGIITKTIDFPQYGTPTGKIVGGPYLGKETICDGWFPEGANRVDPKVASLYYAADRRYSLPIINNFLERGENVLSDRYVESNMGHQGGKIKDITKRLEMYNWLDNLEYSMLKLPRPNLTIFLHMPSEVSRKLKLKMNFKKDQHENDPEHLKNAEKAYLQLSKIYEWSQINCCPDGTINSLRTPEKIHEKIYEIVKNKLFNFS